MIVTGEVVNPITSGLLGSDGVLGLPLNLSSILDIVTQLGNKPGESAIYQNALQNVQTQSVIGGINEQRLLAAHREVYEGGISTTDLDSRTIGSAAALHTLKSMVMGRQGTSLVFTLFYTNFS